MKNSMKSPSNGILRPLSFLLITAILLIPSTGCSSPIEVSKGPSSIATYVLFGRNIPAGGEVSEQQFSEFLDTQVTPAFPGGLTVFDAYGQWRNQDGTKVQQKTKVLWIVGSGSKSDSDAVHKIVDAYRDRFNGAGVLVMTSPVTAEFFAN
jgi:hypothetical protein